MIDWKKQKTGLSKQLMFYGSIAIVLSFAIQTFLFSKWDDKLKAFEQANRDYTEMTRTSLEYQNLYFNFNTGDSIFDLKQKAIFAKQSAEKYRLGKVLSTNVDLFKDTTEVKNFIAKTNTLLKYIDYVNDYSSLSQFINKANELIPENNKLKSEWMTNMNTKRERAAKAFVIFQILGSIAFAIGIRYQ